MIEENGTVWAFSLTATPKEFIQFKDHKSDMLRD